MEASVFVAGLTCVGYAHHLRMGRVEDVDVVDGDDYVADAQTRLFGRRARFDGRHHHRPRAVDAETELARMPLHHHHIVALYTEEINVKFH